MDTTLRLIAPSTLPLQKRARVRAKAKEARASPDTAEAATVDAQLPIIPSSTPAAGARVTRESTDQAFSLLHISLVIPGPTLSPIHGDDSLHELEQGTTEWNY
jgi:hypothetical protein